jgi:dihydropteroate synthase
MNIGGKLIKLDTPKVIGILNLTPDSFYSGSRLSDAHFAVSRAESMLQEGADILDIGAQSTRPGAQLLSVEEEWSRLEKPLKEIVRYFPEAIISVDTFYATIARRAVDIGAHIINDVSGGTMDARMFETIAALRVPYILMHMRGTPDTMKTFAIYENVVQEVAQELSGKLAQLRQLGVADVIIDPGFGFAKTIAHNFQLLHGLDYLSLLFEEPIMAGLSRKSMIYKTLEISPEEALEGTVALNAIALQKGVSFLRVHDVKPAVQAVRLHEAMKNSII